MTTLEELRAAWGDISATGIIAYWRNYFGGTKPAPRREPPRQVPPPETFYQPRPAASPRTYPTVQVRNKFSPVSIATLRDWAELRAEALDLHELTTFFAGRTDSQSPQFVNMIKKYKEELEKTLSSPPEIDADSSCVFVERISNTFQRRFHQILQSCTSGSRGKGNQPKQYYLEIIECMKKYFARIGLKTEVISSGIEFREVQDHMEPVQVKTNNWNENGKVSEVFIQPHYFEYHDDDGEIKKYWIDGKCSVYKL